MGRCKYCGRSGFFVGISSNGLCNQCEPVVSMDVTQRAGIIHGSMELIEKLKKLDTRLIRCDLIVQQAQALYAYESHGIPTITPLPSDLVRKYQALHDTLIVEGLTEELENAKTKARVMESCKSKVTLLSKVLLKLAEFKGECKDAAVLAPLESEISELIRRTQLEGYVAEAKKAEFKGQLKKALDQYQEALYLLKNDAIDDSNQLEDISAIETKIAQLTKAKD